jgi:hypothetical protein
MISFTNCLYLTAAMLLTGCTGISPYVLRDQITITSNVSSGSNPPGPSLQCPVYVSPPIEAVPPAPLAKYASIKPADLGERNAVLLTYIEELRKYISDTNRKTHDSVRQQLRLCTLE